MKTTSANCKQKNISRIPAAGKLLLIALLFSLGLSPSYGQIINNIIDKSFDGDGNTILDINTTDDIRDMVIAPDGKIIVAGKTFTGSFKEFAVARFNSDGSPDNTFGSAGFVTTEVSIMDDEAWGVALQSDGKIVVAGYSQYATYCEYGVVRYNTDGSMDNGFGSGGIVTTSVNIGSGWGYIYTMAIQSDGKIIIGGSSPGATNEQDITLVRYNTDGSLDTGFASDGIFMANIAGSDYAQSIVIQDDGKIVLGCYNSTDKQFIVIRLETDGSYDTGFDSDGIYVTSLSYGLVNANAVGLQSDGKIIFGGSVYDGADMDFYLFRLNTDGSRDNGFGSSAAAILDFNGGSDYLQDIVIQDDDKIVCVGAARSGSPYKLGIARLLSNGTLDPGFATNGKETTNVGNSNFEDWFHAVCLQADGKILAAGHSNDGTDDNFAVVRYSGATQLLPTLPDYSYNARSGYPLSTLHADLRHQSLYLATDLTAVGIPAWSNITAIEFMPSNQPAITLNNFRVGVGFTGDSNLSNGLLPNDIVYGPINHPSSDFNTLQWKQFEVSGVIWTGQENMVIEFSHDNADNDFSGDGGIYMRQTDIAYRAAHSETDYGNFPWDGAAWTGESMVAALRITYEPIDVLPPSNLVLTAGDSKVDLDWEASADGDLAAYVIFRGTSSDPDNFTRLDSVGSSVTQFTDNSASNNTTYYYGIKAKNSAAELSSFTNIENATPVYSGPQNINVATGDLKASLNWEALSAGTLHGYYIYRGTAADPTDLLDSLVSGNPIRTHFLDEDLENDTTYYYRLRAEFTDGSLSGYSESYAVTPDQINISLDGSNSDWQEINVAWQDPVGDAADLDLDSAKMYSDDLNFYGLLAATGILRWTEKYLYLDVDTSTTSGFIGRGIGADYRIYFYDNSIELHKWNGSSWNTLWDTDIAFAYGGNSNWIEFRIDMEALENPDAIYYYYRTEFTGGDDYLPDDNFLAYATQKESPDAPTGLTAVADSAQVTLRWNANPPDGLAKYFVYGKTSSPVQINSENLIDSLLAQSPPDTFYIDGGLTNGVAYYYLITAVNTDGRESVASDEIMAVPNRMHEQLVELLHLNTSQTGINEWGYPFCTSSEDVKHQSIYLASDLSNAGIPSGAWLNALEYRPTSVVWDLQDFRIGSVWTTNTTANSFLDVTDDIIHGPQTYNQSAFSDESWKRFGVTPKQWDGSKNLLLEVSHDNDGTSMGGGVYLREVNTNRGLRGEAWSSTYPFSLANQMSENRVLAVRVAYSPIEPVGNFTADSGHKQIVLSWTAPQSGTVSEYIIYSGTTTGNMQVVGTTTSTSDTVSSLTNGITYYVGVQVKSNVGEYSGVSLAQAVPEWTGPKWYVDATLGSTGGEGSPEDPISTIQGGIDIANAGDTVFVLPGRYERSGDQNLKFGTDTGGGDFNVKNVVLMSRGGADSTVIDGENSVRLFDVFGGVDTTTQVIGFKLVDSKITSSDNWNTHGSAIDIDNSQIVFRDCIIDSSDGVYATAVQLNNNSKAWFYDCIIQNTENTGSSMIEGSAFKVTQSQLYLNRCEVVNNQATSSNNDVSGIGVYLSNNSVNYFEAVNCLFADNAGNTGSFFTSHGGALSIEGGSAVFINSTIADNSADNGSAFRIINNNSNSNLTIFNSIVWGNEPSDQQIVQQSGIVEISYSIVQNVDPDDYGTGVKNINPEFASYSLHDRSPAIGAGTFNGEDANGNLIQAPATDIDGNARPTSGSYGPDMGAYENALLISPYPSPPTNVVTNPLHRVVELSWNASDSLDVLKYYVYQSEDSTNWVSVDTIAGRLNTNDTIRNLNNKLYYWFGVTAVDDDDPVNESSMAVSQMVSPEYTGPIWYVDAAAEGPDYEGSPEAPYTQIQMAINAAQTNTDTVMVLPGTYSGDGNYEMDLGPKNLVIMAQDSAANTILKSDKNHKHFRFQSGEGSLTHIIGLTLKHGKPGSGDETAGGSVHIKQGASPQFFDCVFDSNQAELGGAVGIGLNSSSAVPQFHNCTFSNNEAYSSNGNSGGGAVYTFGENSLAEVIIFDGCTFSGNESQSQHNMAEGGAIYLRDRADFINCLFINNDVISSSGQQSFGGAIRIYIEEAGSSGLVKIINSTIADNSATATSGDHGRGGGISLDGSPIQQLLLFNSIIWDNTADEEWSANIMDSGANISATHNIIEDLENYSWSGNYPGNSDVNPQFEDPANLDFTLSDYSPAIGAGVASFYVNPNTHNAPTVDILGGVRPYPGGSNPDLGAYEDSLATSPYPSQIAQIWVSPGSYSAEVEWDDFTDATIDYFIIYMDTVDNFTPTSADSVDFVDYGTATFGKYTHNVDGLVNNKTYYFRVAAHNTSGLTGLPSAIASATPFYDEKIWYVDDDADQLGDGSPEHPFNAIGDAWGSVVSNDNFDSGDTVLVLPGTYDSLYDLNLTAPDKRLVIMSQKGTDSTMIDGRAGGALNWKRFITFDNSIHDTSSKVIGFKIVHGAGNNNTGDGGIVRIINNSEPKFIDCVFEDNGLTGNGMRGGAIFIDQSSPRFIRCTFANNYANGQGGAIYIDGNNSRPKFYDCVFDSNYTTNTQNGDGGAIGGINIPVLIQRCEFTNNTGYGSGGAINLWYDASSSPSWALITNSLFAGNAVLGAGSFSTGAAVHVRNIDMLFENVTIVDNTCDITDNQDNWQGGAVRLSGASLVHLQNSIVWGNTPVPVNDGQINSTWYPPNLTIDNSLIENGAQYGGIVYDFDPLFVDPANDDYRLSEGSHAIGKAISPYQSPSSGTWVPVDLLDLARDDRIQPAGESNLDLGAYERPEAETAYPGWPQNLMAEPGHHSVVLGWDDPLETADVDYYIVYQSPDSANWDSVSTVLSMMTRAAVYDTIGGLTNKVTYYFAVSAVDTTAYEGLRSEGIAVVPKYQGPVWYVDPVNGVFDGEGSPEEMAQSIKPMIMASSDGDTIMLKPGTYTGFDNRNLDFQEGWDQGGVRNLVLMGEKGADSTIIDVSNSGSFLDVSSGETIASELNGITVKNANSGAIIISNNSQLVVKNCVFRGNSSSSGGAIILSNASDLRVRSVLFEGNSASCPGGAISIGNSTADIKNSIFYDNYAGCYGGAISIDEDQSVLQMVHCLILDNSAESGPGGIMYQSMDPQVNVYNSIFWGNTQNPGLSNDINEASIVDHCILQEGSAVINLGTNWTFDPMITDAENGDFTLSEYSPAIGLGLEDYNDFWLGAATPVPAIDYFSNDRPNPVGSMPDLGPIEHERAEPRRWVYIVDPLDPNSDDSESNDGKTNPYITIQRAINETDMLDTVEVAAGTYVGDNNKNLDFGGMDIVLRSAAGPDATIIDCENVGRGFEFSSGEPPTAKVIGFTVRNGSIDEGGAIAIYPDQFDGPTSPTFWNMKLVDCGVTGAGGAIFADNSNSLFANVVIASNSADSAGVAYLDGGSVTFLNNTIVGNRGNDSNGIVYVAGDHNVLNSILWDNTVNGSEIWIDDGTRQLIDVCFTNVMGGYEGEGNLNLRPGFLDVDLGVYRLAEWSPMIGAADTALFTSSDYDLNPRTISGTTWPDMGAYEHTGMEPDLTNYTNMDWYVSTTGDDGSGTGSDGSPFWSIQYATYYALYSDTIRVEAGIYNQNATVKDKPIAFKATDGPATTVVDGGGNSRVFDISGGGPGGFYLEGITIQNGVADRGAGINLKNTGGIIRNSVISGNSAIAGSGGGLRSYIDDTTQTYILSIDNTIITANSSTTYGGGLSTGQTTVNISGCEISNNTSEHIGGFFFGGDRASFQMSDCIISGNQANGSIGGGGFSSSIGTVTRTLIVGNEANLNPSGGGTEAGGIEIWSGASVVFDNCTFSDNSAEYGGGLTVGSSAVATVTNSILWGNSPEQLALHLTDIEVGTIDISYSLAQGGEDSVYIAPDAGSSILIWGAGNVDRDPRFVGVDDYHIMANSAAVNAGDPTDTDTDNTVRDMGVYPYLNNYSGPDWYSDAVFGSDSDGTGSSGDPFASIQAPINFASPADSIFVEEGTYYENIKFRGNNHKLVGLQGASSTIVDGGGNGPVFDISGAGIDNPTVLEGFTITNGYAYRGGGIYSVGSSLVLRNLIVSENTATAFGGGAALRNVDPVFVPTVLVEDCDFINNHSDYMIGGFYTKDCNTTIDSVKVLNNTADSSYAGLYISGNIGGGFTVTNSIFQGNQTNGYAAAGGFDNFAFGTVSYSIISDNSANLETGGWNSGGFSVLQGASVDFINCTFANNTADHGSGLTAGNGGVATLRNCILYGNTPDQLAGDSWQGQGGTITVSYSDLEGGEAGVVNLSAESTLNWGAGNLNADPLFVDAANSDFELQLLSPCVDAGDSTDTFDPDGTTRDMGALPLFRNIVGGNTDGENVVITGDTTTIIQTDLIVDPNDSLIVEPGSNVYVGNGITITIFGTLDAPGSSAEPISFSTLHEWEEFGGVVLQGGSSPGREIPEYSYLSISDVANDSIPLTITESAILNHMTIAGNDRNQPSLSVGETVTLNYSILESSVNATTLIENHSFVNDTTHFVDLAGGDLSLLDTSTAIDTGIAEAGTNLDPDSTYSDAGTYYHDQSAYPTVTATVIYPAFGDTIIANPDVSSVNFNGLSVRSQLLNYYGRAKTNANVDWNFNTVNGSFLNNNTVSTDLDGFVLNTFYTNTTADSLNQFTIISDGVQDTSGFFRVIPGAPDSLALPAEFSLDTAMIQLDELMLAVDVYDQFDNLVSDGDTVNWTIVPVVGDGDGFTIVTTPTFTDANGQATVDLTTDPITTLVVGDAIRLEAESNDSTVQTMLITIVPDDIYNLSMPESLTADTIDLSADVASIVITATMIDTFNNPLEGVDVSWRLTPESSPDSALSNSITPTNAVGVATVELTTGTFAGYEYWVEAWINEESLMAALNNQVNTDAIRVAGSVTTTNKKGSVSTRQITLPVNIGQPVFPDNWDREAIYDLEDTTNVIRIIPGVPDAVVFEIATDTVMTQQTSLEFVVDIFDQFGNPVADSSLVTWELDIIVGGVGDGCSFSHPTSITEGGSATVVLSTTNTLDLNVGQVYKVIATCEGIENRSGQIHIVVDDPYNLAVDDAYDRMPVADANSVSLAVTIVDTFDYPLEAVPVYWSIIEGTGGSFDNGNLLDTTLTGIDGIATDILTTATISGSEYRVRIWVENVGGYTFSRSIGGESEFKELPAASTGKLALSAMSETPLSVLFAGSRTDFYLDDTTDVITVLPGVPAGVVFDLVNDTTLTQLEALPVAVMVTDQYGNLVADSTSVDWVIEGVVITGFVLDTVTSVTTNGIAINVLRTAPTAALGTTVTVKAQSGTAFISSNNVVVVADDPYNLALDAYDRLPVADNNAVPLSVTIIDTFDNVLDAVPVYWSIIEGTGGSFDNADLLDTTLTGVGGIATNTLTTSTLSGSEYRVRIWVENVGGYTISRSIGGGSAFSAQPAASTGKLAYSTMPETPLSVLSAGSRTDFYLDDTTDVITVLPGVPAGVVFDLTNDTVMTQLETLPLVVTVTDQYGNMVLDETTVDWTIEGAATTGFNLDQNTTLATNGIGINVLRTDPAAVLGTTVTVKAQSGAAFISSNNVVVVADDPYNLTVDDAYDRTPVADANSVPLSVTIIDTFENVLDAVPVYWSIIEGTGGNFDNSDLLDTTLTGVDGIVTNTLTTATTSDSVYRVRIWVENVGGYTFSHSIGGESVFSVLPAASTGKLAFSAMPETPLSVLSAGPRTDFYLDYTTDVITVLPGAPVTITLDNPDKIRYLFQGDQDSIVIHVFDAFDNSVADTSVVNWNPVYTGGEYSIDMQENVTTAGRARLNLTADQNAPWLAQIDFAIRVESVFDANYAEDSITYIIDDKIPPGAVIGLTITPAEWDSVNSFDLSWSNPPEHSGVKGAHYVIDTNTYYYQETPGIISVDDVALFENGISTIGVWLEDNAANEDIENIVSVIAKWDNVAPDAFTLDDPVPSATPGWLKISDPVFSWNHSSDATAGLRPYRFELTGPAGENLNVDPGQDTLKLDDPLAEGSGYTLSVFAVDSAWNETESNTVTFGVDLTPPVETEHNAANDKPIDTEFTLDISFRDDVSGVKNIVCKYRIGGETDWNASTKTSTVAVGVVDDKTFTVQSQFVTHTGVEYKFELTDNAGNIYYYPDDKEYYSVQVRKNDGFSSTTMWSQGIPNGSSVAAYQLISFPGVPTNTSPHEILVTASGFGAYDNTKWRFFTYETGEWIEFANIPDIEKSKAYFLIVMDGGKNINTGVVRTVKTEVPESVSLTNGDWAFIGNPFNFTIPLENVYDENGLSVAGDENFQSYIGGAWTGITALEPWQGYIFKSATAQTLFINPNIENGGTAKILDNAVTILKEDEWLIDIAVRNGYARDLHNRVGVLHRAQDTYDPMDNFEPPVLPGGVSLRIDNRDWPANGDIYTTDIKSVNPEGSFWDMEVVASDKKYSVALNFAGLEDLPEEYDIFLIDKSIGTAQNLRGRPDYYYAIGSAKSTRNLRLVAGTRDFVNANNAGVALYPESYSLSQNFPNPFNPKTTILVSIEDDAFVDLVIYNLLGEVVTTLAREEYLPAGYYNYIWAGKNDHGRRVASGIYFYVSRIKSPSGKMLLNSTKKMILVK